MAQRTRANYKSTKNSRITTNGTGAITGSVANDMFEDSADSFVMFEDIVLSMLSSTFDTITDSAVIINLLQTNHHVVCSGDDITAPQTWSLINTTYSNKFTVLFNITGGLHAQTMPSSFIMNDVRWDNSGKVWTPQEEGLYKLEARYAYSVWFVDISQSIYQ